MKTTTLLLLALALGGAGLGHAAETPESSLKVKKMGTQVIYESWGNNNGMQRYQRGTTVWLQMSAPEGKSFIENKSAKRVSISCQDGAGQPLDEAEINPFFNDIAEDCTTLTLELSTPAVSEDGTLALKGIVPVTISAGMEKEAPVALTLADDQTADAAGYTFKVSDVEREDGGVVFSLSFKGTEAPADISFTTADGTPLDIRRVGHSISAFGGQMNAEYTYESEQDLQEVRLVVAKWVGKEVIQFPLKARLQVGGGKAGSAEPKADNAKPATGRKSGGKKKKKK